MYGTIERGHRGNDVAILKEVLRDRGYFSGDVHDETFDDATHDAVIWFQRDNHLTEDGVVGPRTWAFLTDGGGSHLGADLGAGGADVQQISSRESVVTFGEGTTVLTPGSTELVGHAVDSARQRLDGTQAEIERAADDFWHHAHTETESLSGDAVEFDFASLFSDVSARLSAVFPELAAVPKVVEMLERVVGLLRERADSLHISAETAKEQARQAAAELRSTVGHAASLGRQQAERGLVPHLQETVALHPQLRDGLARGEPETVGQLCDWAGIYDRTEYSPYLTVRTQLEEQFAITVARLRAQVSGRYDTPFEQGVVNTVDVPRARDNADIAIERDLQAHPRQATQPTP